MDSPAQPLLQPKLHAAPNPDRSEQTEPLNPDSSSKGFVAASPSDPQDPSESPLERAERLGHHFKNVAVFSDRPPFQPKLALGLGLLQPQGSQRAGSVDSQLESQLSQSKGGGLPLNSGTRQFRESRFDQDFSGVRIHTDASSAQMNQQIQAQAFTYGQDIYFGAGKFDTGSTAGKQLLAHELTHTVQQTGPNPLQAKAAERPLTQSGHIPGALMAYGLQQEANWMQRSAERFQNPGLLIQRSPVEVKHSTQGQAQISGGFLDWVLPKEVVQAKEILGTILQGASGVILSILKNPVGFLRNLVTGLKNGFQNFMANIGKYLQGGLIGWLTGALSSTGIEMPKDIFSLKGIFSLVTQVLGATWTQVRTRIVSALPGGEQAMAALEEGTEIFQIAMKEGVGGLWDYVKDQFGDLKAQVMDQIKDMVVVQGIQQGIKFILSMLNPVSGILRAALAIYDVVKFFIERGAQVASLVEAVIGSIKSVTSGAVDQAAKLVESALGRSIPVLIGFLSSVAGLGNLASKVQGIFQKMRQPVDKAVNWLIQKAKDLVRKLGQRLGLTANKGGNDNQYTEKDRKTGVAAFEKEEEKYLKQNTITRENAQKVANTVKTKHPVFQSITVIDGKDSWDYQYIFRMVEDTKSKKAKLDRDEAFKQAIDDPRLQEPKFLKTLFINVITELSGAERGAVSRRWVEYYVEQGLLYETDASNPKDPNAKFTFDQNLAGETREATRRATATPYERSKNYIPIARTFSLPEPNLKESSTESQLVSYYQNLRQRIIKKYKDKKFSEFQAEVLNHPAVRIKDLNRWSEQLASEYLQSLDLAPPGTYTFKQSGGMKKKRTSDSYDEVAKTLIERKTHRTPSSPTQEELDQMGDYFIIVSSGIAGQRRTEDNKVVETIFTRVRYIFFNEGMKPLWERHLRTKIPGKHTIVVQ